MPAPLRTPRLNSLHVGDLRTHLANIHLTLLACVLMGCSSGLATVETEVDIDEGSIRMTIETEGRNTFTALGVSCEAKGDSSCTLTLPGRLVQAGWNTLPVQTARRTEQPVEARFYVGGEIFAADCTVAASRLSPDPAELLFDVSCRFAEGFHGELAGKPLDNGRGAIAARDCLGDVEALDVDLSRPLLRGSVPLDVVNEGGGRMRRGLPVGVPAPVVQVSLDDWASPWFEEELPLRLRAEPGATLHVNGSQVEAGDGMSVTVPIKLQRGENTIIVEARRPGYATAKHTLSVEGRHPDTQLLLDQDFDGPLRTDRQMLRLSGSTNRKAKLYLNGRPLGHRRGRFDTETYLEEGKNEIQLLAVVEPGRGVEPRKLTRIDIEVHRETTLDARLTRALKEMESTPTLVPLSAVAEDPWSHLDATLRFPMRIDHIVESPSMDGICSALIGGLACTERVAGNVMVGWGVERSWVCVGDEVPVVVEYGRCLQSGEGDDVEVVGTVTGALGGRSRGITVDRPRIEGLQIEALPRAEIVSQAAWHKPLPSLLGKGRR